MKMLCMCCIFVLFLGFSACNESELSNENTSPATTTRGSSMPLYWRGWPYGYACALRDRAIETYTQIEIDGSELIGSTEGSVIIGYYDKDEQLQIVKIAVYGETGRYTECFYPMKDAVAIKSESIRYTVPFVEVTEEDQYSDGTARMSIEDGKLYYYIDTGEPMYPSDNTWYAEIYAKAVEALG